MRSLGLLRIGVAVGVAAVVIASCDRRPIEPDGPTGAAGGGSGGVVGSGGGVGSAGAGDAGGAGAGGAVVGSGGSGAAGGVAGSGVGGVAGAGGSGGGAGGRGGSAAGSAAGAGGTGGVAADCADACTAGLVCERYPPPACADPQWVAWPMPNGAVDVAAGAPNPMSFTDNGDGTVTDGVTRLMWQQVAPADTPTFGEAGLYCGRLTLAGHEDWRLPSLIELVSIADMGRSEPAIDTTVFPGTPADFFWSSTIWGTAQTTAASLTFARGSTRQQPMETRMRVRCVR